MTKALNSINQKQLQDNRKATASLVLGSISVVMLMIFPFIIVPVSITGILLGIVSIRSQNKGFAIAGIVMCSVMLAFTVFGIIVGTYIFYGHYF